MDVAGRSGRNNYKMKSVHFLCHWRRSLATKFSLNSSSRRHRLIELLSILAEIYSPLDMGFYRFIVLFDTVDIFSDPHQVCAVKCLCLTLDINLSLFVSLFPQPSQIIDGIDSILSLLVRPAPSLRRRDKAALLVSVVPCHF